MVYESVKSNWQFSILKNLTIYYLDCPPKNLGRTLTDLLSWKGMRPPAGGYITNLLYLERSKSL